jgi:hypothetical protein
MATRRALLHSTYPVLPNAEIGKALQDSWFKLAGRDTNPKLNIITRLKQQNQARWHVVCAQALDEFSTFVPFGEKLGLL